MGLAVGGSRESERSSLEVPSVGEVRRDVGGVVAWSSGGMSVFCVWICFKECWSVVARSGSM